MPLSMRERVRLTTRLLDAFQGDDHNAGWPSTRINLVLRAAELDEVYFDDDSAGDELMRRLAGTSDGTLLDIVSTVLDVDVAEAAAAAAADPSGIWREGAIRLFLSHSAVHKAYAAKVADELSVVGVDAFVAHDSIEPTRSWQAEILRALHTAEVFVGIVHPEFTASVWCQQEVGCAIGRGLPCFFVRIGADPPGFPSSSQWPGVGGHDGMDAAVPVITWLNSLPDVARRMTGGIFEALRQASNYFDAEAAAKRIDALGRLTATQFDELDQIFLANNQVHGSVIARRALQPLYARHRRNFPDH